MRRVPSTSERALEAWCPDDELALGHAVIN